MRTETVVKVSSADRIRLEAIAADLNGQYKYVWRARIVLLTADGCGTVEIIHQTSKAQTAVWRCPERAMADGVNGLRRDGTRPPGSRPCP